MPSPSPVVKILFVGDMHLGRRASRIPDRALEMAQCSLAEIGPEGAWDRVVETAITQEVQAIAFAGDLVHRADDMFEAKALLERGVRKLKAAGITVVAVAGNHDTLILPALAEVIEGLHLLGPQATWSTHTIAPGVQLVGWSFPARHHTASPLLQTPPAPKPGVITIGLLHADLNAASSNYAPVAARDLLDVGYDGWALGHIHTPDPKPNDATSNHPFYLGSITGAIPTETGAHGPVLATITPGQPVHWQRLPLAPLRWEHLNLDAVDFSAEVVPDLLAFISDLKLDEAWAQQNAHVLALRITLVGTHEQAAAINRTCAQLKSDDLVTTNDGRVVFIEKITGEMTVPWDLVSLAKLEDPPGLIARQIIALQNYKQNHKQNHKLNHDEASNTLLADARLAIEAIVQPNGLAAEPWSDEKIRGHLIAVGRQSLNTLLSQRRGEAP